MEQESILNYGYAQTEVNQAIDVQAIQPLLNLEHYPISIAVEGIDQYANEDYAMLRRYGFGGSDSSILLGVNPFKTIEELIKEKASNTLSEEEKAIGDKVAVRKGRDLEPLIIMKFEKYMKQETIKPKDMYRFKEYPYLAMNFDGVTGDPKQYFPAEIKVVTTYGEKHYNPSRAMFNEVDGFSPLPEDPTPHNMSIQNKAAYYGIPPYYYTQVQQEMMALNAPFGYLSVLFERDWRFFTFLIWKDEKVWTDIILQGYKNWEKVVALNPERANGIPLQNFQKIGNV